MTDSFVISSLVITFDSLFTLDNFVSFFSVLFSLNSQEQQNVAVGIDIRSGESINYLQGILEELENDGKKIDILFLDAEDAVLVKRYKETRHQHPLSGNERISGRRRNRKMQYYRRRRYRFRKNNDFAADWRTIEAAARRSSGRWSGRAYAGYPHALPFASQHGHAFPARRAFHGLDGV